MIPKINKILYATDLSPNAVNAFAYAVNSARQHKAEIVLLHVIDPLPQNAETWMRMHSSTHEGADGEKRFEENLKVTKENLVKDIKERIRVFAEEEFSKRPDEMVPGTNIIVEDGYPAETIIKKCEELQCDIVIMGTHGKGALQHTLIGSVALRVIRLLKKPIFLIPLVS